jgi:HlyD family secretion protein
MKKKFIFPILAILGIFWALTFVAQSKKETPAATPIVEPSHIPFASYIAGAGLTEPNSENISIGLDIPGTVKEIKVKVGDEVKKGDVLFVVEDSTARSRIAEARAQIAQAQAELTDQNEQYSIIKSVKDQRAISKNERNQRRNAVAVAKAKKVAAEAQLAAAESDLRLRTVKAPIDGTIMTMNLRPGEFAATTPNGEPMIRMGNLNPMHIRIDIDENDAWRFDGGSKAVAFVRGNPEIKVPLEFVRIEPYVRPKRSLTGESAERVDTRVLQVIYSFDPSGKPIYAGQQMDVYIETAPSKNLVAIPAKVKPESESK